MYTYLVDLVYSVSLIVSSIHVDLFLIILFMLYVYAMCDVHLSISQQTFVNVYTGRFTSYRIISEPQAVIS